MANNLGIAIRNEFLKFLAPITGVKIEGFGLPSLFRLVGHTETLGLDPQLKREIERIAGLIDDIAIIDDEELSSWEGILQILVIADDVIDAVEKLDSTVGSLPSNAKDLGKELVEKLFTIYLRSHRPNLFHIASFCNIITPSELTESIPMEFENGELTRLTQFNDQIHFERISEVFSNLTDLLKDTYLPNNMMNGENAHHAAELLFYHFRKIGRHANLSWKEEMIRVGAEINTSEDGMDDYDDDWDLGSHVSNDNEYTPPDLTEYYKNYSPRFSIFSRPVMGPSETYSSVGLTITASSAEHPEGVRGFIFSPQGNLDWENTQNGWTLNLNVNGSLPDFVIGPGGITGAQGAQARAKFTALSPELNSNETFHFGAPEGTRLDIPGFQFLVDLKLDEDPELILSAESKQSKLFVQPTDGFLKSVFPDNGLDISFDLGLGWSSKSGFFLTGSSGLTAVLPLHLSIGPLEINTISLELDVDEHGIRNMISTSMDIKMGPIQGTVEGIGLLVNSDFKKEADGNLGPLDLNLNFTSPSKIGLTIDTGAVTGGGYLDLDPEKGQYDGALELDFKGLFGFSAIGVITTKFPDGSEGFSLLLLINVTFDTPIALGFNFYLGRIGGLIGLHRTLKTLALQQGVKDGSIENIMFPENVIANINKIISDLEAIYPAKQDQFVLGIIARITWNKPAVLIIDAGIVVEFPSPTRVAILGVIRCALPTSDKPILELNVAFAGVIDFDNKILMFDASIFDSRILTITLEGEMALRISWGENPDFLVSVGGFHPVYSPPKHLKLLAMERMTVNILSGNPNLVLTAYFAVTTNTIQFGAGLDFSFKVSKFGVYAKFSFDVLIQFSPFRFMADVSASASVKLGSRPLYSISLKFNLEGPTPWRAHGHASFKVLFVKVKVKFDQTWGEKRENTLPSASVLPLLLEEASKDENWATVTPMDLPELIIFADSATNDDSILVKPGGSLEMNQKVVPLDLTLQHFGNYKPDDISRSAIKGVTLGGRTLTKQEFNDLKNDFAPAAYKQMEDADKLEAPSYVKQNSGVRITATDGLEFDYGINRLVQYETVISDLEEEPLGLINCDAGFFNTFISGGDVGKSAMSQQKRSNRERAGKTVTVAQEQYAVVSSKDLSNAHAQNEVFDSKAEADEYLKETLNKNPSQKGKIQLSPIYEMV